MVQDSFQLNGTNAHKHSDSATYSTEKSVLQGVSVYCEIKFVNLGLNMV